MRRFLLRHGFPVVMTSGRRTRNKQALLYQNYLLGRSPYPAAPPGRSKHEKGLAFDIWSTEDGLLLAQLVAPYLGLRTVRNDPIHFEV